MATSLAICSDVLPFMKSAAPGRKASAMRPYVDGSTRHSEALSGYTKLTVERAVSRWILRMHTRPRLRSVAPHRVTQAPERAKVPGTRGRDRRTDADVAEGAGRYRVVGDLDDGRVRIPTRIVDERRQLQHVPDDPRQDRFRGHRATLRATTRRLRQPGQTRDVRSP